jgi:4-hydroxy-tetrahydrodipicolinate synthase
MSQPAATATLTPPTDAADRFRLAGVFSVLPTAFHEDGSLDVDGTRAIVRATIDAGVAGLTVLGVMGEAAELDEDERRRVVNAVAETRVAMIVGVSGESHQVVVERAGEAAAAGAAAVMVSPSRTLGLDQAIDAAAAAGLPIVVQDYPPASGVTVTPAELAAAVGGQPLVVGIKAEAPPTSDAIAALRQALPELGLVGGLGGLFLIDELRAGADGVMTGFAMPERLVEIVATFPTDPEAAERQWTELLPLMRFEAFAPFNLAARKEVWRLRGVIASSRCRRPGASLDERSRRDVRAEVERLVRT